MSKAYKVSYKTYFNDRLKQVSFHGELTYPLYIQVTFDRKSIFFKSNYFELLSKPRYAMLSNGKIHGPPIDSIIEKENSLIDFVIDKTLSGFSLDKFKQEYNFYGKDLCDITEEGFTDYLFTFLHDKGLPALATAIKEGSKFSILYDIVRDMKKALNRPVFDELMENSFYYAPPYLPLYEFIKQVKKWPLISLSAMEWEDPKIKSKFTDFIAKNYPTKSPDEVIGQVNKWLAHLKNDK